MSFISAISPLLSSNTSAITVTLSRNAAGTLTATVIPKITVTDAQESDPAIATLKAALARPVMLELPDADPDTTFNSILAAVAPARDAAQIALSDYLAAIEKAKAEAKAQDEAKKAKTAEKTKATPAKGAKATKPAAAAATESDDDEDDDGDDASEAPASVSVAAQPAAAAEPSAPTATPAAQPALLADLF